MQRKIRFRTIGIVLMAMLCLNPVYGQKDKRDSYSFNIIFLEKDSSDGLWSKTIASFVRTTLINKKGQFFDIYRDLDGNINYSQPDGCLIVNVYYTKCQTIGNEYIYIYIMVIRRGSME